MKAVYPGMSLTEELGGKPYTRPPELTHPEDALHLYLDKLGSEEAMVLVKDSVERGMDIKTITEGLIRLGTSRGKHSIDVGMIIAPVIHEKIRGIADAAGLDFDDGFGEGDPAKAREKHIQARGGELGMKKFKQTPKNLRKAQPVQLEEAPEPPKGKGLVARRGTK